MATTSDLVAAVEAARAEMRACAARASAARRAHAAGRSAATHAELCGADASLAGAQRAWRDARAALDRHAGRLFVARIDAEESGDAGAFAAADAAWHAALKASEAAVAL